MPKDAYYFPHDFEPTSDPKIQALIGEYGAIGYGIYWRIIEMLHSDSNHRLPLKQYIYLAIAKQMLTSVEQIQAIVKFAIDFCELFLSDGEYFWSNRVNVNIDKRNEISEKRAIAGRAGANAKQMLAIAKQNLAKERKRKERKLEEIKDDKDIGDEEYISVIAYLNEQANRSFEATPEILKKMKKIAKLGYTIDDMKKACRLQVLSCKDKVETEPYMHPSTIFRNTDNFDRALNLNEQSLLNKNKQTQPGYLEISAQEPAKYPDRR